MTPSPRTSIVTMRGRIRILVVASVLIAPAFANGAYLAVMLAPARQTLRPGETPHFVVTVRANAGMHRMLKFADSDHLRANYAELIVSTDGKPEKQPRA